MTFEEQLAEAAYTGCTSRGYDTSRAVTALSTLVRDRVAAEVAAQLAART